MRNTLALRRGDSQPFHRWVASACVALGFVGGGGLACAATTVTTTTSFDYDTATGLLKKVVVEPSDSNLCSVTEYTPDGYGHPRVSTTRNCNGSAASAAGAPNEAPAPTGMAAFASRATTYTYSVDQRFITSATNGLLQSEGKTYDSRFGSPTSLTDPNRLTITWVYDGLGRRTLERRADGTQTKWTYVYCTNPNVLDWPSAPVGATTGVCSTVPAFFRSGGFAVGPSSIMPVYYVQATPLRADGVTPNGSYTRAYYDSLGREVRTETQGFDGDGNSQPVYEDTGYGLDGTKIVKTLPYSPGSSPYYLNYTYDVLGRVTRVHENNAAGGPASVSTTYSGLTTTVQDPEGYRTTHIRDAADRVTTIIDAKGGTLIRAYDPLGSLVRVTDAKGNVTSMVYDKRGRKTAMYDPDLGVWGYCYDALGQLKARQDPNARGSNTLAQCPSVSEVGTSTAGLAGWTTMAYDLLGRMTAQAEPDLASSWIYDNCSMGVGKLCAATARNGYSRTHAYDGFGRPSSTTATRGSKAYTASVAYDPNTGRISSQTYPSGLTVSNTYTPLGFPLGVVDERNGTTLWTAQKQDPMGHVLQYQYGNGLVTTDAYFADGRLKTRQAGLGNAVQSLLYSYDLNRNVDVRADLATGVTASYAYDELNRLTSESRSGGGLGSTSQTIAWTYDALGNISTRTESGATNTYNYNASGLGSLRPHAVGSVSGRVGTVLAPTYSYDAGGNLISGAGRTVTWTSANMVKTVIAGIARLDYKYDPEGDRFEEAYTRGGVLERTTVYINPSAGAGLFYEEESGVAGTRMKHYVSAGGSTVAMIVCTASPCTSVANSSTQYWHEDHLGSVSVVTDQVGTVIERMAYEPFGKRRNVNGATDTNGVLTPRSTDRGYTEHEHMDEVGLINMNGRVYDPGLGRFTSADPNVPYPEASQSYNRYSYGRNNPLRMRDPSGFADTYVYLSDAVICPGCDGDSFLRTESLNSAGLEGLFSTLPGSSENMSSGAATADPVARYSGNDLGRVTIVGKKSTNGRNLHQAFGDATLQYQLMFDEMNKGTPSSAPEWQSRLDGLNDLATAYRATADQFGVSVAGDPFLTGVSLQMAIAKAQLGDMSGLTQMTATAVIIGLESGGTRRSGGARGAAAWKGAGPIPGTFGVGPGTESVKGLQNFFPRRRNVEFIFDPATSTFVVGNGTMKHSALASSIGADTNRVVGGIFSRGSNGSMLTNEASGHFWQNWNPQVRRQFVDFMDSKGLSIIHREGM